MKSPVFRTLPAFDVDMGGLAVKQALPTNAVEQIDPFLLLHHTQVPVNAGTPPLQAGVPPHPHRGFSAVTVVIGGEVHHRDSLGNSSVIGEGGIQWVSAGHGIVHSERPSAALAAKGGAMDVIQLWVNHPASHKLAPAAYHAATKDDLPKVQLSDNATMHLITGSYGENKGAVPSASPMLIARVYAGAGEAFQLDLNPEFNSAAYIISGKGKLQGHGLIGAATLYQFEEGCEKLNFEVSDDLDILLLSGKAIDEAMASYGPFVMNTQTEIMQALRDHQMGKLGVLIEE